MSLYVYPQCDEYEEMTSACIDTSNNSRSKRKIFNFKSKRQCALFCNPILYHIPGLANRKRNVQYKMNDSQRKWYRKRVSRHWVSTKICNKHRKRKSKRENKYQKLLFHH